MSRMVRFAPRHGVIGISGSRFSLSSLAPSPARHPARWGVQGLRMEPGWASAFYTGRDSAKPLSWWDQAMASMNQQITAAKKILVDGNMTPGMDRPWVTFSPNEDLASTWNTISDAEWGGFSHCSLEVDDDGVACFSGELSLAMPPPEFKKGVLYGGTTRQATKTGMCGMFSKMDVLETDLNFCTALKMKVMGDGRKYVVSLKTAACRDGDFFQTVIMPKAGVWSELILPINNFTLTNCGLINVEDGAMNTRMVRSLGITMHDGKEGPFKFSMKTVEALLMEEHNYRGNERNME